MTVGDTVHGRLRINGQLQQIVESADSPESAIEQLFIVILSRKPTGQELSGLRNLIGEQTKDPAIYEDIVWSLLNSTEFLFNH
jgi:hypothetical protein